MEKTILRQIFPNTLEILRDRDLSYLQDQFGRTLHEELMVKVSAESSHWFPVFLKVRAVAQEVLEVAEFEFLRHSVALSDASRGKLDAGGVGLNLSLQFVELYHAQPKLQRDPGLYCFFKNGAQFTELRLNLQQALLVDILHNDRKYNLRQLIETACSHELGKKYSREHWAAVAANLIETGFLMVQTAGA